MRKLIVFIALTWMFISALEMRESAPIRSRLMRMFVLFRIARRFPLLALLVNRVNFFRLLSEMFSQTKPHRHRTNHVRTNSHHHKTHARKTGSHHHSVH